MIPGRFLSTCHFCGRQIDNREPGTHQFVAGWAKNRSGGGAHGLSLPKRENKWSCGYCIRQQSSGTFGTKDMFNIDKKQHEPEPTNAAYVGNMLTHACNVCGSDAAFGVGVSLRKGDLGLWYCVRHRPTMEFPGYPEEESFGRRV